MLQKIKKYKKTTAISLVVLLFLGYFYYRSTQKEEVVSYVTAKISRGNVSTTVSGSGQVALVDQMDIKPLTSGVVSYIGVKEGQEIKAGHVIARLDATEVVRAIRDAENSLQSAKISLEKLRKPAENLTVVQAENALQSAKEAKRKTEDDLVKSYEDRYNAVADAFLDLPSVINGMNDLLYSKALNISESNIFWYLNAVSQEEIADKAKAESLQAEVIRLNTQVKSTYEKSFDLYKASSRYSSLDTISSLAQNTSDTVKLVSDYVKATNNYLDFIQSLFEKRSKSIPSIMTTHQASLDGYTGTTNRHLTSLLSQKNLIKSLSDSLSAADRSIKEKEESLVKIKSGNDALDIKSAEVTVRQRENALRDAREKYAEYTVLAPFDGIIANVAMKRGESVSGANTLAVLLTKQKLIELSVNEVDAVKIKPGMKVSLKFDAIPDAVLAGSVRSSDVLGTVVQGVVSYGVQIVFDTEDQRVKPSMSVTADIITGTHENVLNVPIAAIKGDDKKYIEILVDGMPVKKYIETGLSNDDIIEVVGDVKEGDEVVTQTIGGKKQAAQTNIFQGIGGRGAAGQQRR